MKSCPVKGTSHYQSKRNLVNELASASLDANSTLSTAGENLMEGLVNLLGYRWAEDARGSKHRFAPGGAEDGCPE
jgi:hypothetical protein